MALTAKQLTNNVSVTYMSNDGNGNEYVAIELEKTLFQTIFRRPATIEKFILNDSADWIDLRTKQRVKPSVYLMLTRLRMNMREGI